MTAHTPEQAAQLLCPTARTFAVSPAQDGCRGPACAAWRWVHTTTSNPLWTAAVRGVAEATGEKPPYAKAARAVADDMPAFGMAPTRGFCGLGGPI
jgi:hypothetical protein